MPSTFSFSPAVTLPAVLFLNSLRCVAGADESVAPGKSIPTFSVPFPERYEFRHSVPSAGEVTDSAWPAISGPRYQRARRAGGTPIR